MFDITLEVEDEDFLRELAATEIDVAKAMALTMDRLGWEVIAFLRSLGHGTQPPARPGEPNRSAHPGQWSDVTGNLANAYTFELYAAGELIRWVAISTEIAEDGRGKPGKPVVQGSIPSTPRFPLELHFLNGMEYAAALEARDGYWVLREITGSGGPVARALRTVIRRIAPDARIEGI